jgi:hypothetical protein
MNSKESNVCKELEKLSDLCVALADGKDNYYSSVGKSLRETLRIVEAVGKITNKSIDTFDEKSMTPKSAKQPIDSSVSDLTEEGSSPAKSVVETKNNELFKFPEGYKSFSFVKNVEEPPDASSFDVSKHKLHLEPSWGYIGYFVVTEIGSGRIDCVKSADEYKIALYRDDSIAFLNANNFINALPKIRFDGLTFCDSAGFTIADIVVNHLIHRILVHDEKFWYVYRGVDFNWVREFAIPRKDNQLIVSIGKESTVMTEKQ